MTQRITCTGSLDTAKQVINSRGVFWDCVECGHEVDIGFDGQQVFSLRHTPNGAKLTRSATSDGGTWDSIGLFYSKDFAGRVGLAS